MSVATNVESGKHAREIAELAEGDDHFWKVLYELLESHFPKLKVTEYRPMRKDEAREFRLRQMPFGKYMGVRVKDVPEEYLEWIADQDFLRELQKYVERVR